MFFLPSSLLLFLFVLFLLPFVFIFGLFHLITLGLEKLGLPPEIVLFTLLSMLIGSFINIPLGRKKIVIVEQRYFFGLFKRSYPMVQGLSINVGGAIIPLMLAGYFFTKVPFQPTIIATVAMIVICWRLARFLPPIGIALPMLLPPLFAALFAMVLTQESAAPVAFISGVLGVLIGADLFHLPRVIREGRGMMSIGGAGVFDGIFLIGIVSTLLAGF